MYSQQILWTNFIICLVDYILIVQRDVRVAINPNEVASVKYVTPADLTALIKDPEVLLTPWFRLISTGSIEGSMKKGTENNRKDLFLANRFLSASFMELLTFFLLSKDFSTNGGSRFLMFLISATWPYNVSYKK